MVGIVAENPALKASAWTALPSALFFPGMNAEVCRAIGSIRQSPDYGGLNVIDCLG